MATKDSGILARIFRRSVLVVAVLTGLAFLGGMIFSYGLLRPQLSPSVPALAQCGQTLVGEYCPGQYTTLGGLVNITYGSPYMILLVGYFVGLGTSTIAPLPTLTAGIFYGNGHYGYFGLYVPVYETVHGFKLFVANGTEVPPGTQLNIAYHASIRYLSGSTNQTCTPNPSVFTLGLTESSQQNFSC